MKNRSKLQNYKSSKIFDTKSNRHVTCILTLYKNTHSHIPKEINKKLSHFLTVVEQNTTWNKIRKRKYYYDRYLVQHSSIRSNFSFRVTHNSDIWCFHHEEWFFFIFEFHSPSTAVSPLFLSPSVTIFVQTHIHFGHIQNPQ